MTKLTPQDVEQRLKSKGFKLIGQYENTHTKTQIQCFCGQIFDCTPDRIFQNNTKSCGHCNDPCVGDKFGKLTIIIVFPQKIGGGCQVVCECECGNMVGPYAGNRLTNSNNRSCGYCNRPELGCVFNKLTIIKILKGRSKGYRVCCRCVCGNIWGPNQFSLIESQAIQSCGHCKDPHIGDRYGSLTVIKIRPSFANGCSIKCECDCGQITKWYISSQIISGHTSSCGNCYLKRNGKSTSRIALQLHSLIEQITAQRWEHNYHIKGVGCIDIVNPDLKIAIEYDGYYNHMIRDGDRSKKDKEKINKLIKSGWKVLNIKSGGHDLPTEKQLRQVLLNHFQHGSKKKTITMKSWKRSARKYEEKK